jgi:hypothetical protein
VSNRCQASTYSPNHFLTISENAPAILYPSKQAHAAPQAGHTSAAGEIAGAHRNIVDNNVDIPVINIVDQSTLGAGNSRQHRATVAGSIQ